MKSMPKTLCEVFANTCPHCGKPISAAAMLGSLSTPAKARAARANGKLGGRPKTKRVTRRANSKLTDSRRE